MVFPPFHILRDIALQQTDRDRFALWVYPCNSLQAKTAEPNQSQWQAITPFFNTLFKPQEKQGGAEHHQQRNTIHTDDWRKTRQWASGCLRITQRQPWEASKQSAA